MIFESCFCYTFLHDKVVSRLITDFGQGLKFVFWIFGRIQVRSS